MKNYINKFLKLFIIIFVIFLITSNNIFAFDKILHRGNGAEPDTLDPHLATGHWEGSVINDIFVGLFTKGVGGESLKGSVDSYLLSDDGLVYTFYLRKDHFWSDGTNVTSIDYVNGFRRVLDPLTASQYGSLLYLIKNGFEVNSGSLPPEKLGVEALDEYTLKIYLNYPAPYFEELLTHYTTYPVPSHILSKYGKEWIKPENIVTNGPYKLNSWRAHDHISLKRNEKFYDNINVWYDEVKYYPTEDNEAALRRFRAGELDINSGFPENKTSWLRRNMPKNIRQDNILVVTYLIFNTNSIPFDNARVRRAVSLSIDRDVIVNKIRGFDETIAWSLVPKGIQNYKYEEIIEERKLTQEDRYKLAKKLLEESGYNTNNPLKFTLKYRQGGDQKKHMVAIQSMMRNAGISVTLEGSEPKVLYNYLRTGDFQVGDAGWIADFNDASNFLFLFQKSSGPLNYGNYNNPIYDNLIDEALSELDIDIRAKKLKEAEIILLRDMPFAPILFGISRWLVKENITGWKPNYAAYHPTRFLRPKNEKK